MTECEGINNCTTWTFLSKKGYSKWPTGEEAVLEVESVNGDEITISRTDVTGSKAGLIATYKGTLHAGRLGGEFESHYQGHDDSGNWYAILGTPAPRPPAVMHLCLAHCQTWTLGEGPPFDKLHYGSEASGMIAVVDSWTRESVVMHRTDYGSVPGTAVLTGKLSSDGNSIVDGNIAWTWHPCCGTTTSGRFIAAWGSAISTVPGSDAESSSRPGQQVQPQITLGEVLQAGSYIKDWIDVYRFFTGDHQ
jgi:hypothetical protein